MKKAKLYTWEYCPFCKRAKSLLESKNISYKEYNIEGNIEKKNELFKETGQNTVPYIFIDDEFIGGYDQLVELDNKGKL